MRPQLINFKANVSEFGLFRSAAKTRGRLIAIVILVTALEVGVAIGSAHYVLEVSASVGLNLFIITANMMLVLVASYLQSVLLGDIFFGGPWRERVILGKEVPGAVQDHNAEFMIMLLVLVIANAIGLNFVSNGFFDTYEAEGFFRAQLRSTESDERLSALVELGDVTNFELWENRNLRTLVETHMTDNDPGVRARAAWTLGEMKATAKRPALINALEDENLEVRREAAHALGKLGNHEESRIALETNLQVASDHEFKISLLRGLALMESPLSSKIAWSFTRDENEEVSLHAYWVLRNGAEPGVREELRRRVEEPKTDKELCALLDTLKMVATDEDTNWARRRFASAPAKAGCEPLVWEDLNERQHYVLYSDSFRVKYMKIVANATGTQHRGWFGRIVADPEQPWRVREVANEIVARIDKAGRR